MNNMELLANALEYMEENLGEDIKTEDVAEACYCSKSTLEKLFKCVNNITIREYLIRRRMTKAARMIVERPQMGLLEIALYFGYSANESFTRAFKQVWNCKPSEFRSKTRFSELFPRLERPLEEGDQYMRERRHVDISELYDLFISRRDCYFVCCDIKSLIPINEISRKAGDMAILEALRRLNETAGEGDVVFRIGGDEFAVLTESAEESYAKELVSRIKQLNEQTFTFEGKAIPLSMYAGYTRFEKGVLRYNELFTELHTALKESKK